MSAFTKVLIVFVLLLSVIFAAAQVILFQQREDFGKKYVESQKQVNNLQTMLEKTEKELDQVKAKRDALQDKFTDLEERTGEQIENLNTQINKKDEQIKQHSDRIEELTTLLEGREEQLKAVRKRVDDLQEESLAKDEQLAQLRDEIDSLDKRIVALNKDKRELNQEIIELRTEKQEIAQRKSDLEDQLEQVLQATDYRLDGVQMPPIDAVVVSVSDDMKHVVINKGRRDDVSAGYKFIIHDQQKVLGYFYVNKVLDDTAAGRLHTYQDRTVEAGDLATTKIR